MIRIKVGLDSIDGSHLVVVIHEVELSDAAIGGPSIPVVNNIAPDIQTPGEIAIARQPARQTPIASLGLRQQIVMPTADIAAGAAGVAMTGAWGIILVTGLIERFGNHDLLYGHVLGAARGDALVQRPTRRTMVHNGMVHPAKSHAIKGRAGELARVRPKVTHYHVLASAEAETIFPEVDALAGRGLPGDVEFALVFADGERTLERDQPRD